MEVLALACGNIRGMIVTRLGHASLLVESPSTRLLIDPGAYSNGWHDLTDLDGMIVTHQHADHLDARHLASTMTANPAARLVVEPQCADVVPGCRPEVAEVGETIRVGDLTVETVGGSHALIHERVPRVGNVGYVVSRGDGPRLFHPGDSYDAVPSGVDVLALPLTAPWAKVAETVDFANAVNARLILPIHDAIVSDAGREIYARMVTNLCGASFEDVPTGHPYSL
ncbi:MBL fold metallo-hydrolase [soil metagenome]